MRFRATVAVVLIATGLAVSSPRPTAQAPQDPAVFRTGVDVVELDVTVLDEHRQPVRGLTAEDFTVIERGESQPIVSFAAIDLPPRPVDLAPWVNNIAPDVATNRRDAQRVVVILMDDFNTRFASSDGKLARAIGHALIDGLGPSDLAAVIYVLGRRQGQEFTTDRARLRAAVDRFTPSGFSGVEATSGFSAARNPLLVPIIGPSGACPRGRCVQDAMKNTAEILRAWPGMRKALVLVSPFTPRFHAASMETVGELSDWALVFDIMQEANLTVYQFDPRGLEVGVNIADDLGTFSDATGGFTVKNTNAPEAAAPQMFRENSSYYMLGFQPRNLVRNGQFRSIEVRVNRPGVTVRTRDGYFAPRNERSPAPSRRPPPSATERAIAGGLPSGDLPISVTAAPMPGPRSSPHIVNVVVGFTPRESFAGIEEMDLLVSAFRDDWKATGTVTETVRVTMPPAGEVRHVDIPARLDLPPGRYEIRAALNPKSTGEAGSAYVSVVVPDFAKTPLTMSGVLIDRATAALAGEGDDSRATPTATTLRRFAPGDRVSASLHVRQGGRNPLAPVDVTMRIVDTTDRPLVSRQMTLEPGSFGSTRAAELRLDLPFEGLEPGEYLVSFMASSPGGTVGRDVRVTVE
jgi:VWFA-related protein